MILHLHYAFSHGVDTSYRQKHHQTSSVPQDIQQFQSNQYFCMECPQIWLPLLAPKQTIGFSSPNSTTFFSNHAEMRGERVQLHLRFLKWVLRVKEAKKTTNVFRWGELGEVPLFFALEKAVSYYRRVLAAPCRSRIYHTIQDQQRHSLKWSVTMSGLEKASIQELKKQFMELCEI